MGFPGGLGVKDESAMQEVQFLGQEDALEESMATHSSILPGESPWTEVPGGLQSMSCKESDMTEATNTQLGLLALGLSQTTVILRLKRGEYTSYFIHWKPNGNAEPEGPLIQ